MKHKRKQYQEPTLDIIKMSYLPYLLAGSEAAEDPSSDPGSREYYYTDPFHYLHDINE